MESEFTEHESEIYNLEIEHAPEVELIQTVENPRNIHLSLALENLWLACRPVSCNLSSPEGYRAHRRAVSSIIHAWCAMESSVNLALFYKLKYPECAYYLDPSNRNAFDKRISDNLGQSLKFEERLTYLSDPHNCCTTIDKKIGKLRQFEKLRNALVHGYNIRKSTLVEEVAGKTVIENLENGNSVQTKSFIVRDEELIVEGKKYSFEELGLQHSITKLCRHDADKCVQVAVGILQWLDSHYGIQASATWQVYSKNYIYYSREQTYLPSKTNRTQFIGYDMLWDGYVINSGNEKTQAIIKRKKQPTKRAKGRKKKSNSKR